ncbi:chaperone protein dnaJ 11, chloroplastic-like [Prunus avium]|uniref:Chaperone protein dnaJ 11, chloroplastic-like n=1 Tax=Prunus avium TaxID=42229 RepID=A0A6P5SA24_PRUAV|nr:chaperone protein dnaJ 11, chloroplastic-like [Prunus avium]
MAAVSSTSTLYEVLGLTMGASGHEIKAAYRRLARSCHPDVVAMNQKQTSANEFMKIHAAYATLSDPDKRAEYDRDLYMCPQPFRSSSYSSASMAAAASAMAGSSRRTYRNWETDQCW